MLGLLLHAQGKPADAVRHYEKALEANPNAATAANNLAWLYAENGELRSYVNVFVNEDDVRTLKGLKTEVQAQDTLMIVPSIAGG